MSPQSAEGVPHQVLMGEGGVHSSFLTDWEYPILPDGGVPPSF